MVNVDFNFFSDAKGKDPDTHSPTLRRYHQFLWSKPLPNGKVFSLEEGPGSAYLFHRSELGEFVLGSDAITHSYRKQKRKQWLIDQVREEAEHLFRTAANIASYIVFPKNKIDGKQTINQARGVNRLIDDRFDLTLECIRRFFNQQTSPLSADLLRYKSFFDLFGDFKGYVEFFLLQDLVDEKLNIKFYLPFNDFRNPPGFSGVADYLEYKKNVLQFNASRKKRISEAAKRR